jgi:Na+/H+ antiporter NhaD/arsenite permease-like protein
MAVVATVVFLAALAVVAFEWVHRTKAALAGAGLMVVIGVLDQKEAVAAVDWGTLGLLVGMMIIVGLSERTGIFTYLSLAASRLSRGNGFVLLSLLAGVTGILSAFLDNLTAILLVVPVTILVADLLAISPIPLVLAEVIASNIGGTATLIGDPPNILIGTHVSELSFDDFVVNLAPVSIFTLIVVTGVLALVFRRSLRPAPGRAIVVSELDPKRDLRESPNVGRTLVILIGTIVLFFLHSALHLTPAVVALIGATAMLLAVVGEDVEQALNRVQWSTIFFFLGLFVMVGGLEARGVIDDVANWIASVDSSRTGETMIILWGSAAGSALVDNIPFTAAMLPVVDKLQVGQAFDDVRWWALSLGACFGGNATLIAAAAHVAAAGVLDRNGRPIGFVRFLVIGLPVALLSLVIATVYLFLFQL